MYFSSEKYLAPHLQKHTKSAREYLFILNNANAFLKLYS